MYLIDNCLTKSIDKKFPDRSVISTLSYQNTLFVRLVANRITFTNINFKYCIFDDVYLRNCVFNCCDFTGCRFINSNLLGSSFRCCSFDYATFKFTRVDNDILTQNCSLYGVNLKSHFAKSLRSNYQQLGDIKSANQAMDIELATTKEHLYKKCFSSEKYYRNKYSGLGRINGFRELIFFKFLEFVWGNGENLIKLFRAFIICLLIIACLIYYFDDYPNISVVIIEEALGVFFGIKEVTNFPTWLSSAIVATRLSFLGFFISIMVKRFGGR